MIPKASQRSGGQQLATHLLNEFDNDRVEVAHVRGAIAPDLHGAFAEWSAVATGTKCRKYLYSLSVNPDPEQGPLTREQYLDFIGRTEKRLGLDEQPRAVVFHVKHGREHAHVVWSRIDTRNMRAVQLSHDRHILRAVVLEFSRDLGRTLPQGVTRDRKHRDLSLKREFEKLGEKQQEERTGVTREERITAITSAWRRTRDGRAFVQALEEDGYLLARGDRRAYVVVDRFGEIHALARQIDGARTKDVKARLAGFPLDKLPDAKAAQAHARALRDKAKALLPDRALDTQARRKALAQAQERRWTALRQRKAGLEAQHTLERSVLAEAHGVEDQRIAAERLKARPHGILAFLARITGVKALIRLRDNWQDRQRAESHKAQDAALARRHARELADFSRHERALEKIDTRERRSLETALRRETFRLIARGRPAAAPERESGQPSAKPAFDRAAAPREKMREGLRQFFNERAQGREHDAPDAGAESAGDGGGPEKASGLSAAFAKALRERAETKARDQDKGPQRPGPKGPGRGRF